MKRFLAVEQSTDIASVAVLNETEVIAKREWKETRARTALFDVVRNILDDVDLSMSSIDAYIIGLGPGSYTGLRISLASVMAFALPSRQLVYGLNSAASLALLVKDEFSCDLVIVAGDARRGRFWAGVFDAKDNITKPSGGWHVVEPHEMPDFCPPGSVVVTSDWDRIGRQLEAGLPDSVSLIKDRKTPSAETLGRLAVANMKQGHQSEPLLPIYINPSVVLTADSVSFK